MNRDLPIPEEFDQSVGMISTTTDEGVFHEVRRSAQFAAELVAGGSKNDLSLSETVLSEVFACQEMNTDDPHCGNFRWMREDEAVTDLNAVEFVMEAVIPMMLRYGERLAVATRDRASECIRAAVNEIIRLDVHVAYSNIAMLDILNSTLGGQYLDDEVAQEHGRRKLRAFIAFTSESGTQREFNSPTYTSVIIRAARTLTELCSHAPTRVRTRTMVGRIALGLLPRIHRTTGRWAGPHSRAYHPTVVCERPPEIATIQQWLSDGTLPSWSAGLLTSPSTPFQVTETPSRSEGVALTTYNTDSFALGVATRDLGDQSNVIHAHIARPGADRPGVLYSRYVVNDRWLGDFRHETDRSASRNLIEEGRFLGVQDRDRAFALYGPRNLGLCSSAKASFVVTDALRVDGVWVNGHPVGPPPLTLHQGDWIALATGEALVAICPIARADMGRGAPIKLVERDGDLVLDVYHYAGPAKQFWEYSPGPNPFFQGAPFIGVYLEIASRSEYEHGAEFAADVASGSFRIETQPPFTTDFSSPRVSWLEYTRQGRRLGIEVDLIQWEARRRWTDSGEIGWPTIDAPGIGSSHDGAVTVGDAHLECGDATGWLYANADAHTWVAGVQGDTPVIVMLDVPGGTVRIPLIEAGTIVWERGTVVVDATGPDVEPRIVHRD